MQDAVKTSMRGDSGLPTERPYDFKCPSIHRVWAVAVLPFFAAFVVWAGLRIVRANAAAYDLAGIAVQVVEAEQQPDATRSDIVESLASLLGGDEPTESLMARASAVVRTVEYRLSPAKRNEIATAFSDPAVSLDGVIDNLASDYRGHLLADSAIPLVVQMLLMSLIPTFYIVRAMHARRRIDDSQDKTAASMSFGEHIWLVRNMEFLRQVGQWRFYRKFLFGLLFGLALTFLMAPIGLRGTMVAEYSSYSAIPPHSTIPAWFVLFSEAPHFVYGYAGYFLYSLLLVTHRFYSNDLGGRLLLSLITRGIIVGVLSLVLSGVSESQGITALGIFAVGVFPQSGLQIIARITQSGVASALPDEQAGVNGIPYLSIWKQTSLREWGVTNVHDLAHQDAKRLLVETGISPSLLLRSIDRALLVSALGKEAESRLDALSKASVNTATELLLFVRGAHIFSERWALSGVAIPVSARKYGLSSQIQTARKKLIQDLLGVKDICPLLDTLDDDRNTHFVIDNRLFFSLR